MEFITPLHPLAQSLAAEARRSLLQVYPDRRGLPPRRLAARRVPKDQPPSAVFTFMGVVTGGGDLCEEHLIALRVTTRGQLLGSPEEAYQLLRHEALPGEVPPSTITALFSAHFEQMAETATSFAQQHVARRIEALRLRRAEQAEVLRSDLDTDLADRLEEIQDEERRALGLIDERTGQLRMFSVDDHRPNGFQSRRAAIEAQADARRAEIADFERVDEMTGPSAVRPMGALFLVPEDVT